MRLVLSSRALTGRSVPFAIHSDDGGKDAGEFAAFLRGMRINRDGSPPQPADSQKKLTTGRARSSVPVLFAAHIRY